MRKVNAPRVALINNKLYPYDLRDEFLKEINGYTYLGQGLIYSLDGVKQTRSSKQLAKDSKRLGVQCRDPIYHFWVKET